MKKRCRFILVDSNSLIHRAYHAYPSHLTTSKGEQINAVYGFTFLLLKVIEDLKPDYLICAFDSLAPTKRHKVFKEYKAHRKPMEDELVAQLPKVYEIVEAFEIPIFKKEGYEADDLIGTIEFDAKIKGMEKIIVSGDQDMFQLADSDTKIYLSGKSFSQSRLFDPEDIKGKTNLKPSQIVDFKALYGDPSDNIPGVGGIGKKGAETLMKEYGSLEEIYKNLEKIDKRFQNKLADGKEKAYLSQELARIIRDAPIEFDLKKARWGDIDIVRVRKLFQRFEFRSLLKKAEKIAGVEEEREESVQKVISGKQIKTRTQFIEGRKELIDLLCKISASRIFSIYTVADADSCVQMKPQTITISFKGQDNYTFAAKLLSDGMRLTSEGAEFEAIIKNKEILKVGYDVKTLMHCMRNLGIRDMNYYFDLKIASFLVQAGSGSVNLKDLVFNYLGEIIEEKEQTFDMGLTGRREAGLILWLYEIVNKKLEEIEEKSRWDLKRLFEEIEMPLVKILTDMEASGIDLDRDYLSAFSHKLSRKLEKIEHAVYDAIGHEFNLNSPKQVSEVLFKELKLSPQRKNKGGSYSTSASVLESLRGVHPVIDSLLLFRELAKVKSTYTNSLLDAVDKKTGRIHSSFNLAVTSTGRLSSTNPNLQNIPIVSDIGKKVRRAFIAERGWKLISFDYSQQELRLLAHLSQDRELMAAFSKNLDIHTHTASGLFSKTMEEITKKERSIGKTVNFAVMYGMGARGLSESLKIEYGQAEDFINKYFQQYSGVKKFYDKYIAEVEKQGYAVTMFGRRKSAAGLTGGNFFARKAVYRELINFPLQGSAADMMKLAMIDVSDLIHNKYDQYARIILQIHDELILEVKNNLITKKFTEEVKNLMQKVLELKVPIEVNYEIGNDLSEIH
ncbi:MAG: DNA polymerase I [Candidatus Dojkabacteria bacterium]|nr:DNA polymerase I [Candidatus Dojkabacteria bacterium]